MFLGAFAIGTVAGTVVILAMTTLIDGEVPKNLAIPVAVAAMLSVLITVPLISRFGKTQGNARLRPHATIDVSMPISEAIVRLSENVSLVPGAKISGTNARDGIVRIRTEPSAESFGEVVTVIFTSVLLARVSATVKSRPRYPLTLIDGGRNEANVHAVLEILQCKRP
jgi:hypothetical protein